MSYTPVPNNPAITLLPTGPSGPSSLNAQYIACDPANGNYFIATNRDLVTFICLPSSSAPAWSASVTYTAGQVVNGGSPAGAYIALAYYISGVLQPNSNQSPGTSPNYWAAYTSSTLNVISAPDACTGRTSNVVNYAVPVFDTTQQTVEFLVLPSSVFTQASGQVQFQASSNLVYVYIRNL